jgi:hypothetical protein
MSSLQRTEQTFERCGSHHCHEHREGHHLRQTHTLVVVPERSEMPHSVSKPSSTHHRVYEYAHDANALLVPSADRLKRTALVKLCLLHGSLVKG